MSETINREAGHKGPRLQRQRAVFHMLDAFEKKEKAHFYSAIEYVEDVYFRDCDQGNDLIEENKNYDSESSFTLANDRVLNTLVAFLDNYFQWNCDATAVALGFYSTNKVGKEKVSDRTKSLGITLPGKSALLLLQEKNFDYPNLLETVKLFVIDEYNKQYVNVGKKGNIDAIKLFREEDWKVFLSCISWEFGQPDEQELNDQLLKKIRNSKLFIKSAMDGKEEIILSRLLDLLDERHCAPKAVDRFVYASDVQLKFKEVHGGVQGYIKLNDPVWEDWKRLPPPTDKRSLPEKISSVCSCYSTKKITNLARKVGIAKRIEIEFTDEKLYHAVKYRVYDRCEDELLKVASEIQAYGQLDDALVDNILERLTACAEEHIKNLSNSFDYNYNFENMIQGIVLDLFNECFLSLNLEEYA